MDEQNLNQQQTTPLASAAPAAEQTTPLASQSSVTASPRTDLPQGVYDYSNEIETLYNAQQAAKAQNLANVYQQNVSTLDKELDKIPGEYQTQANDLATQYERNRRNLNFQADLQGLNTGTASQMGLAQNNGYLNSFGKLRASEAEAKRAIELKKADLEMNYKNAVAQSLAEGDYQKATALLAEYQRRDAAATNMEQYNKEQQKSEAALRAAYGDFSVYESLYGAEAAKQMRDFWVQSNPQYAYANGLINAATYKKLTGRDAPDTSPQVVYRWVTKPDPNKGNEDERKQLWLQMGGDNLWST